MAEQPICDVEGCNEPGWEMDHRDGDQWNRARENVHMMCKTHHSQKTARENGGGRKKVNEGSCFFRPIYPPII